MKQSNSINKFIRQLGAVVAAFVSRLGALPANISPLGSVGFFGNPVLFAVSILAFDLFVKGIYPGFWLTYVGFACYPLLGKLAGNSLRKQLLFLPLSSLLFFVFSNLGVWWYWYDHTLAKLVLCYALAVPFYARTLASDVAFGYGFLAVKNSRKITAQTTASLQKIWQRPVPVKASLP